MESRETWFCRLVRWLRDWRAWQQSADAAALIARDIAALGLSPAEISSARLGSEDDIGRMLQRFGLDPASLPHAYLAALRDAERVCAHCLAAERCQRFFAAPAGRDAARLFCPNAALFDQIATALRADRAVTP